MVVLEFEIDLNEFKISFVRKKYPFPTSDPNKFWEHIPPNFYNLYKVCASTNVIQYN